MAKAKKTPVTTVKVGNPVPKPTITVLGIEFEQGDNRQFGKCRLNGPSPAANYYFMEAMPGYYLLWNMDRYGVGYLDYYQCRDDEFRQSYTILPWDTNIDVLAQAAAEAIGQGIPAPR